MIRRWPVLTSTVFHHGDPVIKAGGGRGTVIAAFRDRSSGEWRYVVVDDRGVQQTLPSAQLVRPSGEAARFSFPVHPHMFRHACG
jgi:hypothetical protein